MAKSKTSRKSAAGLRCSFCGKGSDEVEKLVAGPGVYICGECVTLCVEWIESDMANPPRAPYLRATSESAGLVGKPTTELLDLVKARSGAAKGADQNVKEVVAFLRGRGVSWAQIGDALGITRQAAWERFSDER